MSYTYILAPYDTANYQVLQDCIASYPALESESRCKVVYSKSEGDILDSEGNLLVPADPTTYIYAKATADELAILKGFDSYTLYTIATQPFDEYWI